MTISKVTAYLLFRWIVFIYQISLVIIIITKIIVFVNVTSWDKLGTNSISVVDHQAKYEWCKFHDDLIKIYIKLLTEYSAFKIYIMFLFNKCNVAAEILIWCDAVHFHVKYGNAVFSDYIPIFYMKMDSITSNQDFSSNSAFNGS